MQQDARSLVQAMTLEEKVAQLFVFGFTGAKLPERYAEFLEKHGIGGVILFTRNVESVDQTRALTGAIQSAVAKSRQAVPAAIAIDQEGGTVVRMSEPAGYTHMPSNMALGAADEPGLTYRTANIMGLEMRAVGINWDFAPVLDVNNNPKNPVIGVRSYGASPNLVARHGLAAIKGLQDANVAACAKHFPGHGDTAVDSHLALPVIPHDRDRLEAIEFVPFREALKAGLDSVMTAHVFFPALEPEPGLPATLSKNVLTGLLRQEMGFDGVICTDCLEMKAISDNYTPEETALKAVDAGADALLVSHTYERQMAMFEALVEAVRSGRIPVERVEESAYRIVRMKLSRAMDREIPAPLGSVEHRTAALAAARRAVTVAWGRNELPLPRKVTMILPRVRWFAQVEDSRTVLSNLLDGLRANGLEVHAIDCPLDMTGVDAAEIAWEVGPGGTVVFGGVAVAGNPQQAEIAALLADAGCRVIALARRMPYDLDAFKGKAVAGIAVYDDSPAIQQATAELLTGRIPAMGRLPI